MALSALDSDVLLRCLGTLLLAGAVASVWLLPYLARHLLGRCNALAPSFTLHGRWTLRRLHLTLRGLELHAELLETVNSYGLGCLLPCSLRAVRVAELTVTVAQRFPHSARPATSAT